MYTAPDDKLPPLGELTPGQQAVDLQPIGEEHWAVRRVRMNFAAILDDMRKIVGEAELEGTKYLAKVAATLAFEAFEAALKASQIHYGSE
jgi:hypothetical protein